VIPKPLQKLYDRASLFLDKDSTHQDHYWAVGIHKALHEVYGGEIQTAPANIAKEKSDAMSTSRKGVARPVKSSRLQDGFEEALERRKKLNAQRNLKNSFLRPEDNDEYTQPLFRPEEAAQRVAETQKEEGEK